MTGDVPARPADETILAAQAEPALGHDASAPASHPAATALHPGAALRNPGSARLQPHAGAGRRRRLERRCRDRGRTGRYPQRASGRHRVGGHLRLRPGQQHPVERRVQRCRSRCQPGADRITQGPSLLADVPDAAQRHRPGHRSRDHRRRQRRRLSHAHPRRHPAQSRSPARGTDPRRNRGGAPADSKPRSARGCGAQRGRMSRGPVAASFLPAPSGAMPPSPW